jgi:hypothetical protein
MNSIDPTNRDGLWHAAMPRRVVLEKLLQNSRQFGKPLFFKPESIQR